MKNIEKENLKEILKFLTKILYVKWIGVVGSGNEAKEIIIDQKVKVNDEIEIRRGRKIYPGYRIEVFDVVYEIE